MLPKPRPSVGRIRAKLWFPLIVLALGSAGALLWGFERGDGWYAVLATVGGSVGLSLLAGLWRARDWARITLAIGCFALALGAGIYGMISEGRRGTQGLVHLGALAAFGGYLILPETKRQFAEARRQLERGRARGSESDQTS